MSNPPDDIHKTLLLGPIDTEKEMRLILQLLQEQTFLRRKITDQEITNYLLSLKQMRLDGPVDTLHEIIIFLGMLRKSNLLMGPIDTDEEVNLFLSNLKKKGYLADSFNKMKPRPQMAPIKKKRKNRDDDDDDEEDEDNIPKPT